MKNEATSGRLIALETRLNCFPRAIENLERMTPLHTKTTTENNFKKMQTGASEEIHSSSGKVSLLYSFRLVIVFCDDDDDHAYR